MKGYHIYQNFTIRSSQKLRLKRRSWKNEIYGQIRHSGVDTVYLLEIFGRESISGQDKPVDSMEVGKTVPDQHGQLVRKEAKNGKEAGKAGDPSLLSKAATKAQVATLSPNITNCSKVYPAP
jgi:hypothetical protein